MGELLFLVVGIFIGVGIRLGWKFPVNIKRDSDIDLEVK